MLRIEQLCAGYGEKDVIQDVSIDIKEFAYFGIIGPNGAGKSTLLRAIAGTAVISHGSVLLNGQELVNHPPPDIVKLGVSFVPQGHRVFGELSVLENLQVGGHTLGSRVEFRDRLSELITVFPVLGSRLKQRASTLSGGEKQMLSVALALMARPRLLMLDEPSLGLSFAAFKSLSDALESICKNENVTLIVVEQKVRSLLEHAHFVYGMRLGRIVWSGDPKDLAESTLVSEIFGF